MPCCGSFFLFDGYLTGELFSLLCGVYFKRGDVSVAIYKIGKKGEFLPKLYFFGVGVFLGDFFISGVNSRLIFLCQKGLEVYLVLGI